MPKTSIKLDVPLRFHLTGKFENKRPDWIHLTRRLDDYELMVVTRGTLHINCNQNEYALSKGDYLIFPPDSIQHGSRISDCDFYWLHFFIADNGAAKATAKSISLPVHASVKNLNRLVVMLQQLQDCIRDLSSPLQNDLMTSLVLCELSHQLHPREKADAGAERSQIYNDILDYIKWNIRLDLRVSDIARAFGYNEKYLSHLFAKLSGQPLKQYILREKIETALLLMKDTNQDLKQIAADLGFGYYHNFMRAFKLITGLTPTEYRGAYSRRLVNS